MFVDYYEILQISPNADAETIRRVYKVQAHRFHPDNLESVNAVTFRQVSDAYDVLSDPEQRAAYDCEYRDKRRPQTMADASPAAPKIVDEVRRREEILAALYRQRFANPQNPSVPLRDLELLLNTPKQDLEFSLWYLKECGYLIRNDSAAHTITLKGVQFAEGLKAGTAKWIE
jgi:curved DNA-binding protein